MEYPKIETLFERDKETFKVIPWKFKNPVYDLIKVWHWTEKIDGTNIRLIWDGANLTIGGRTNNAQIPTPLVNHLTEVVSLDTLRETFPDVPVVIYGEGYGGKIQKGSYYSATQKFIVFDVLVDSKWWLNWENVCDIAQKLGLPVVPAYGNLRLEDAVEMVEKGLRSVVAYLNENSKADHPAEGLVGRTMEPLFDKRGHRLIVKLKTQDFAS